MTCRCLRAVLDRRRPASMHQNMSVWLNRRAICFTCLVVIALGSFLALLGNVYVIGSADDAFRYVLEEKDSRDLIETLRVLATAFDRANVTYFLLFGTLVGSYRHHGCIPWDDDVDIMADVAQKPRIREALLRQGAEIRSPSVSQQRHVQPASVEVLQGGRVSIPSQTLPLAIHRPHVLPLE